MDTTCALLGGRAAEELVFSEISTGAANDLQRATQIAESMVKEYGMSDVVGLVSHKEDRSQQAMFGIPAGDRNYSEETARQIDAEVNRIVHDNYDRAKRVLSEQREALEKVVAVLFEKETMEGDELRRILKKEPLEEAANGEGGNGQMTAADGSAGLPATTGESGDVSEGQTG